MHTLRRSSPKGLAGKEPACKCSTANVYVHVYFLRLYIFTFKRAIYRYFLANFARIDVIMIIFEKNKAMENLLNEAYNNNRNPKRTVPYLVLAKMAKALQSE